MVFEGVLVDVLNHFLRPYVKNLDASQLKIAIWSGERQIERLLQQRSRFLSAYGQRVTHTHTHTLKDSAVLKPSQLYARAAI